MTLHFAQIGNFGPAHSTENELRKAIVNNGHTVTPHQEDDDWGDLIATVGDYDLVLWTRTASLSPDHATQWRLLAEARAAGTPVVGVHLDRWWGLARQHEIYTEPYFRVDLLFTADGGHADEWAGAGIRHRWLPPAVGAAECVPGIPRDVYRSEIAFVGGWDRYGHTEASHRPALVEWLRANYPGRVRFWPERGQHAVRGEALRDLYASVDVVVGDSCILSADEAADPGLYWSDRVPETIGRGALLIHPFTVGIQDAYPRGLRVWTMGEWATLALHIDTLLGADPTVLAQKRDVARRHVLAYHTYDHRIAELVDVLSAEGWLWRTEMAGSRHPDQLVPATEGTD